MSFDSIKHCFALANIVKKTEKCKFIFFTAIAIPTLTTTVSAVYTATHTLIILVDSAGIKLNVFELFRHRPTTPAAPMVKHSPALRQTTPKQANCQNGKSRETSASTIYTKSILVPNTPTRALGGGPGSGWPVNGGCQQSRIISAIVARLSTSAPKWLRIF